MKNLKQHLTKGVLFAFLTVSSLTVFGQQEQTQPNAKEIIKADIEPPGGGITNPPVILSSDEKINDLDVIDVYPNPNNGSFNLKISEHTVFENIIISDLLGNIITKINVHDLEDRGMRVQLDNVKPGLYLINTGKSVLKFKVQ